MAYKRTTSLGRQRRKVRTAIVLLAVVATCLVLVLLLFQAPRRPATPTAVAPAEVDGAAPKPEPRPEAPEEPRGGDLYLVIDDVGNSMEQLERFLDFPFALTFAVMPRRRYTREAVERIRAAGQVVILHQPMEPVGSSDPGVGALYAGMSREEVDAILDENLAGLESIRGINNHMGSKVTADAETMSYVMDYLSNRGMFFLDSVTTNSSVAGMVAEVYEVAFAERTGPFLDNEAEYDVVRSAFAEGLDRARRESSAVLIGHVHSDTLVEVLRREYSRSIEQGFSFRPLSEYPALQKYYRSDR